MTRSRFAFHIGKRPAVRAVITAMALPEDVKAVLGNLGCSNDARLALLERRFTIPPSPAGSAEAAAAKPGALGHNQSSLHSVGSVPGAREATPVRRRVQASPKGPAACPASC